MLQRLNWGFLSGLCLLAAALAIGGSTEAIAKNGFEIRLGAFSPQDSQTETTFGVDSGPIPQIGYRWQLRNHGLFAGFGYAKWEEDDPFGGGADLKWFPVDVHYRYAFWHDRPVSLYVGGGITANLYDAFVDNPSGPVIFVDETGFALGVGPIVGVEFLANHKVRLLLEAQYSKQLLDSGDLDTVGAYALAVDMSAFRATFGLAFVFGK